MKLLIMGKNLIFIILIAFIQQFRSYYFNQFYFNCEDYFYFILFNSIILEADPTAVSYRVALRNDDIPIGEQTVAQVYDLNQF